MTQGTTATTHDMGVSHKLTELARAVLFHADRKAVEGGSRVLYVATVEQASGEGRFVRRDCVERGVNPIQGRLETKRMSGGLG